ncbi:MAG: hypothetical protein HYZ49_06345 [Chloroflexi bacterium]|nr:hypothetical protein [Chloroflexota bacterium]
MSDSIPFNRRAFLQQAILFTGAGLALGGVAAYAKDQWDAGEAASAASTVSLDSLRAQLAEASNQVAILNEALAASEAALTELRPQLATALGKNAELQNALTQQQADADSLKSQLAEAVSVIASHKQLIDLFDKLDAIGLDDVLQTGLNAASTAFAGLLGLAPLALAGIASARSLLDNFEIQFPSFRANLDWLKKNLDALTSGVAAVEAAIQGALSTLDPALTRMTQFIIYILDHLPFGIGQSAKNALNANDTLYASLPAFITGASSQIFTIFNEPFGTSERGLSKSLLQPVREKALAPSEKLGAQVTATNDVYVKDLHVPASVALTQRAQLRKEIADFREKNKAVLEK